MKKLLPWLVLLVLTVFTQSGCIGLVVTTLIIKSRRDRLRRRQVEQGDEARKVKGDKR